MARDDHTNLVCLDCGTRRSGERFRAVPERRAPCVVARCRQTGRRSRRGQSEPDPHFQPRTRPACWIHLRIMGPCASSRVFSFT